MTPRHALRLAVLLHRSPRWSVILGVLLAVLSWGAALAPTVNDGDKAPRAAAEAVAAPSWNEHRDAVLRLAYPPSWTLHAGDDRTGGDGYLLASPEGRLHLRISVVPPDGSPDDLHRLERRFVRALEQDETFVRHYVRIRPRARIGGHTAAMVEYEAVKADGERVRGLRMGRRLSDGRLIVFDVTAGSAAYLHSRLPRARQVMASVAVTTPDPGAR